MSAQVINLRRARKSAARKRREGEAESNRRLFGRSKEEKERQAASAERETRLIDGHRRDIEGRDGDAE